MEIPTQILRGGAQPPQYMSAGAAGADLFACLDVPLELPPGESVPVPTGVALAIPHGTAGFVFARSGLATKSGLAPANKVGVIDSDYRGEIVVWLYNQSDTVRTVAPGDRIAQIVFLPTPQATFFKQNSLEDTERGEGGFGSTGP